jgi:3'-phosphoadenosine 5'-phosphosulfate sulfotransferase (PAPS reductase)/FAD synthetase
MQNIEDPNYWKPIYLLHSQTKGFKYKVQKSKEVIKEFLDLNLGKYCCSISTGKDSTVLMHLIWKQKKDIKFVSEKDDMDFPEEMPYLKNLEKKYSLNLDIISPNVKLWDVILDSEKYDITEDIHSRNTAFSTDFFYKLMDEYKHSNNYTADFWGLRAGESKGRLMNFKRRGFYYYNEQRKWWVCNPLSKWTATDIFAYLFFQEIPILEVYFKTLFVGSPENIRKSWILPSHQTSQGQAVWLRHYYPDIFNKLAKIQPKLLQYA